MTAGRVDSCSVRRLFGNLFLAPWLQRLVGAVPLSIHILRKSHISSQPTPPDHSPTHSRSLGPLPPLYFGDHIPKTNMKAIAYAAALLGLVSIALGQTEDPGPSPTESVGCEPHGDHWYVPKSHVACCFRYSSCPRHCEGPRETSGPVGVTTTITSTAAPGTTSSAAPGEDDHDDEHTDEHTNEHTDATGTGVLAPSPTESVGCEPHGDHWYVAASTWLPRSPYSFMSQALRRPCDHPGLRLPHFSPHWRCRDHLNRRASEHCSCSPLRGRWTGLRWDCCGCCHGSLVMRRGRYLGLPGPPFTPRSTRNSHFRGYDRNKEARDIRTICTACCKIIHQ